MKTVAVVGVGLIGASFGLALRKAGFGGEIIGVSSEPAIQAGLKSGAISTSATLAQAAARADLLYLAQPIDRILETIEKLGPLLSPDCLVTDAGSTKVAIVEKAEEFLPPANFLGGHPMTGKEQRGAEAAEADLFRGRTYVLTPNGPASPASEGFRSWLRTIGANPIDMTASEHDTVVAYTSHLPQVLSTALAATLERQIAPRTSIVFGPGLLDMTRLALSSPDIWGSILHTNRLRVAAAVQDLTDTLVQLKADLEGGDPVHFFGPASKFASQIRVDSSE
jgi:prephenate dehydrogenase